MARQITFRVPAVNWIIGLLTAMIGHTIHNSTFWSIMDFFFWPFVWIKWFILQEVNLTIIKQTFEFFLK
jgi:hypothetical protein